MKKAWLIFKKEKGFSVIEVLLAISIFGLLITVFVGAYLYGEEATMVAGLHTRATMLAQEGLEAVRNIRDNDFNNLIDGTHGLIIAEGKYTLSGVSDTVDVFTREIIISSIDSARKNINVNVTWPISPARNGSVSLTTRLTNFKAPPVDLINP